MPTQGLNRELLFEDLVLYEYTNMKVNKVTREERGFSDSEEEADGD